MPYTVKKLSNGKTAIVKKATGKKVGESENEDMAQKAIKARMMHEKGEGKADGPGKDNTPKHEKAESHQQEHSEGNEEDGKKA